MPAPKPGRPSRPRGGARKLTSDSLRKKGEREDLENEALGLMLEGKTVGVIAKTLDIGYSTAHDWIVRASRRYSVEKAEDRRAVALARIEKSIQRMTELIEAYQPGAIGGDVDLADVIVKCTQTILAALDKDAKYTGFAAPEKVEMTGKDGGPMQFAPVIMIPPERPDDSTQATPAAPAGLATEPGTAD